VSVQIDERLPALVRLVKAWAGARGLNDASNGTFNSYALTLLVRTSWQPSLRHC
jgi:DNA polymerase sigma